MSNVKFIASIIDPGAFGSTAEMPYLPTIPMRQDYARNCACRIWYALAVGPKRPPEGAIVEQVARLIDPTAFNQDHPTPYLPLLRQRRAYALRRARVAIRLFQAKLEPDLRLRGMWFETREKILNEPRLNDRALGYANEAFRNPNPHTHPLEHAYGEGAADVLADIHALLAANGDASPLGAALRDLIARRTAEIAELVSPPEDSAEESASAC